MITPKQLQQHAAWLRDGSGKRIEAVNANLRWANLSGANLRWANLSGANLSRANLSRANLSRADLSDADLRWANLSRANLSDADLSRADLSDADLSRADLSGANLSRANLSRANLSRADLSDADLSDADLRGAIGNIREIKSAQFDQWTVAWSSDVLAIGCQQHAIEKWRTADPRWIDAMDSKASNWWSRYGALVLQLIDASPATGVVLVIGSSKESRASSIPASLTSSIKLTNLQEEHTNDQPSSLPHWRSCVALQAE
jgi:uncharacterized protein YjbI with pentapeptide repeats